MRKQIVTAMLAATALFGVAGQSNARVTSAPLATALDAGFSSAIHTDCAASVYDPKIGKEIWLAGDVTQVDGVSTEGYYGFPHGALITEVPGSSTFTVLAGTYGTDYWNGVPNSSHFYQPVPNWPDGTYFWASVPIIEGNVLHVIGIRIQNSPPAIIGAYDARFNATTLRYQAITSVPSEPGDDWAGYAKTNTGYWFTSQHGDSAFVPLGQIDTNWTQYPNSVPVSSGSWPVYTVNGWHLFAAQAFQTPIEEYTASAITGPWSGPTVIDQMSVIETDGGIIAHPDLPAPPGKILINWAENDTSYYDPHFEYVSR